MIGWIKKIIILGAMLLGAMFGIGKADAAMLSGTGPDHSTNGTFSATTTDTTDFKAEGTGIRTLISYRVGFGTALNMYATSTASSTLAGMSVINSISFIVRSTNGAANLINMVVNCDDGNGSHSGGPLSNTMVTPTDASTKSFNAVMATPVPCEAATLNFLKVTFTIGTGIGTDGVEIFGTNNGYLTNGIGLLNTSGTFYENYEMFLGLNTSFNAGAPALDTPGIAETKLNGTWPFSYYFDLKNMFQNASSTLASATPLTIYIPLTGNSTTTLVLFSDDLLRHYLSPGTLTFLKQIITWSMWLSFILYVFYRIKSFWQNAEPEE